MGNSIYKSNVLLAQSSEIDAYKSKNIDDFEDDSEVKDEPEFELQNADKAMMNVEYLEATTLRLAQKWLSVNIFFQVCGIAVGVFIIFWISIERLTIEGNIKNIVTPFAL